MNTECLTYEQLQAYSAHTIKKAEGERLYMHISSCELCACAVNGFSAYPFVSDDLVAIHREIDTRVNATAAFPLTLAQFFIVVISMFSIVVVYSYTNHTSKIKTRTSDLNSAVVIIPKPQYHETETSSKEEISSVTKTFKKIVNVIQYKKYDRSITPLEQLDLMEPIAAKSVVSTEDANEGVIAPHYNSNVIYIYDLKVSDYYKLYFTHQTSEDLLFHKHTPAFKENEKSVATEFDSDKQSIPADRVLKEGLADFNKQEFSAAVENFNLLLENNPKDANAQFYSALAFFNLQKSSKAIERFHAVLENENDAFYPEAQWYLALVTLKMGDIENAKQLLNTIVSEKGFYSNRAYDKLKSM